MLISELSPTAPTSQTPALPKYDFDLAIVGGGIVGATLACALKDSGLKLAIIESQPLSTAAAKRQAYNLSITSGRILDRIGVWEQILPQVTTYRQISLCDGKYPRIVEFSPEDLAVTGTMPTAKEGLGYVGEHCVLLTAMQEFLEKCSHVTWFSPAEVVEVNYKSDRAQIKIQKEPGETLTIQSPLVVGADGAKSRMRQSAEIDTKGWKYWQSCVAMTVKTEKPHHNIAFERFWPSGPMGVLPLPGNRVQVVWTAPHEEARTLQKLDAKEFLTKLEERTGGLLGKLELLSDRYLFPVQLMQSDRYARPRLALVGDAAHCCHPVGGQGLNMGIRDAAALAQVLTTASEQGEDLGGIEILKRYEKWRKKENLLILGVTDFLDRMFSASWLPLVKIRRLGLWGLGTIPLLKCIALRVMTGLFGRYCGS